MSVKESSCNFLPQMRTTKVYHEVCRSVICRNCPICADGLTLKRRGQLFMFVVACISRRYPSVIQNTLWYCSVTLASSTEVCTCTTQRGRRSSRFTEWVPSNSQTRWWKSFSSKSRPGTNISLSYFNESWRGCYFGLFRISEWMNASLPVSLSSNVLIFVKKSCIWDTFLHLVTIK